MRYAAFFTIALIAAAALYLWFSDTIAIDRCLDAGGRWDHHSDSCDSSP